MSRMNHVNTVAAVGLATMLLGLTTSSPGNGTLRAEPQNASVAATVWDGVYTADQSQRGERISNTACSSCHGDKLVGSDIGPALSGEGFLNNWSGSTADDLFDKIQTTMPADGPGTLKPQQYADLLAYIFKLNSFPAGSMEITLDRAALKLVKITAKKL